MKEFARPRRPLYRRASAHGQKFLSQADFSGDCCIVFGSEGDGISAAVLEACDEAVAIPMPPTVDSLNVGAAAAVFLYEVARQRGKILTLEGSAPSLPNSNLGYAEHCPPSRFEHLS